jgi:hypothetical protein
MNFLRLIFSLAGASTMHNFSDVQNGAEVPLKLAVSSPHMTASTQ